VAARILRRTRALDGAGPRAELLEVRIGCISGRSRGAAPEIAHIRGKKDVGKAVFFVINLRMENRSCRRSLTRFLLANLHFEKFIKPVDFFWWPRFLRWSKTE
jgi:hypothetical protein